MAIIAYASANSDPTNNPTENASVDLSTASVPTSITLYGGAEDTENPNASFSWSWTLLDPTSSGLVLSSTTTQNVTVSNIQNWENVRLHLVATNIATSATSESNILLAPSSSFVEIHVLSANTSLQKPAKGARDWHPALNAWVSKIEDLGGADPLNLNDLGDVTTSTGAQLDILTGGGNAEQSNTALHTHEGNHVNDATTTAQGVVLLEEASHASGTPKMLTEERLIFSQSATRSVPWKSATLSDKIEFTSPSSTSFFPHVVFFANEEIYIEKMTVVLLNGGASSPNQPYQFDLVIGTNTDLQEGTMSKQGAQVSGSPSVDNKPLILVSSDQSINVAQGRFFGVAVIQAPQTSDAGYSMRVTLEARRRIV